MFTRSTFLAYTVKYTDIFVPRIVTFKNKFFLFFTRIVFSQMLTSTNKAVDADFGMSDQKVKDTVP